MDNYNALQISKALLEIASAIDRLGHSIIQAAGDVGHDPIHGETLGGLEGAIESIADAIRDAGDKSK